MIFKRNKFIFNLHLLLTFLFALPLLVVTLSAPFAQYRNEIAQLINSYNVNIAKSDAPYLKMSEILAKFSQNFGTINLVALNIQSDKNKAVKISVLNDKQLQKFFINPYNGEAVLEKGSSVAKAILSVHRNLGLGLLESKELLSLGKNIVAISSIGLFVLILSGFWLYLPTIKGGIKKAGILNFKRKGYGFLYQLHGVLGIWLSLLLCVMCLTGLYWSYDFVRSGVNTAFGVDAKPGKKPQPNAIKLENFSQIDEILTSVTDFKTLTIYAENDTLKFKKDNNTTLKKPTNGLKFQTPRDVSRFWLSIHQGSIFGEVGRVIYSFTSTLFVLFVITGFMMMSWRLNRRAG
ncbi:hypothetical protein CR66_08525 [Campylobacter mucosalis]|uniref:PepSY-associated TM helix domain-containing protein n=1 Tax=Campylobacter mucosalis TaxID=202 RepID=UPI0004DA0ED7|nr:PepSY-associated TM helix domain-containing protein [Campylobacter mucosalis]KEA45320.1 hypothetical protein CR66_08525 [Campylobacter mucosalis]QKF62245.1 putative iron-regulated membrane protein [Campylobacter mucosalis]